MVIRKLVKQKIDTMQDGVVVTAADFDVPRQYRATLVKALNQFEYAGVLKKVSKGRYYKPRQSYFGEMPPSESEIVKDFLVKEGKAVGYITGTRAFTGLALTTQLSSEIMVGTNVSRRPLQRKGYKVTFLLQPNPIVKKDIPLLILLDALRLIKKIPATTPNETAMQVMAWIKNLSEAEVTRLKKLAIAYQPFVRALLGAILEQIGINANELVRTLNPVTRYEIGVSQEILTTAIKWNVV